MEVTGVCSELRAGGRGFPLTGEQKFITCVLLAGSQSSTPTPVFLPGEFHGQRSLVGSSPWGRKELDRTEQLTLPISDSLEETWNCLFCLGMGAN